MYNPDAYQIADFAAESPINTFRVGLFVISTINQHFERVPYLLADYGQYGAYSRHYMGWQHAAIADLAFRQGELHTQVLSWRDKGKRSRHKALRTMVEYSGFGIVKASFFIQLVLPDCGIGCLDRHNLRLYGLSETAFSSIPQSTSGLTHKINTYLALCDRLGGSESLWDKWCSYVSALRPHVFETADSVSKLHVECITGRDDA
jgi:hypothetical protein